MVLIIGHHFALFGELDYYSDLTLNTVWLQFLQMGGKIGVNLFVLISGYFMITAEKLRISKVLKFWGQVIFYSVLFYIVMQLYRLFVVHNFEFSFSELLHRVFPIIFNQWWFASTYFALLLLSPFINVLLRKLDKLAYLKLLIIMFVMWSVITTCFWTDYQMSDLSWFVFIYALSGYIRLYGKTIVNKKNLFWITFACYFVSFGVYTSLGMIRDYVPFISNYSNSDLHLIVFRMNEVPIFIVSLLAFILLKNTTIKQSRVINTIASATFGVYLFHEDNYIRQMLTNHVYGRLGIDNHWLIPYSIIAVSVIFLACMCADLIRQYLIEKPCLKHLNGFGDKFERSIDRSVAKLSER